MEPLGRARVLALAIAAAAIAAAGVASSSASSPPHPARGTLPHVSSAVPYVAPWQTGFERYSTQILTPEKVGTNWLRTIIPEGQWYRIIYLNAAFVTSAVAANRSIRAEFEDANNVPLFQEYAPTVEAASTTLTTLFAPDVGSFANVTDPVRAQASVTLPDVLWPPGTRLFLKVDNNQAGDGWSALTAFAVEVYTPLKDRPGVLIPTPAIA